MAQSPFDTIVAAITGSQAAAVAWIRLSGPDSWAIASRVFGNWPSQPQSHRAVFGVYSHGDSGLALPFEDKQSYTGERSVELSIHGSRASSRALVQLCLDEGARMAEPGEFTLRAFLNGRVDLTQAEAVRDTVESETDAQLRAANLNRRGVLKREVSDIRNGVLKVLANVEASVDFSEEIGDLDRIGALTSTEEQIGRIEQLLASADTNRILRNGFRIAIVGPPNAGKSSLLNALLGEDRSIVSDIAGTTRDYVEERVEIGGVPIVLIDTAGLRESTDRIESIGIQRTISMAANSDAIWYVYDSQVGFTPDDQATVDTFDRPVSLLANKSDLVVPTQGIPISAITRDGLSTLLDHVTSLVATSPSSPLINARHQPLLIQAKESLQLVRDTLSHHAPDDLLSVLLTEAAHFLGEITGETAAPDMIERIFHDFCIGK